jgi:hypothetical protein
MWMTIPQLSQKGTESVSRSSKPSAKIRKQHARTQCPGSRKSISKKFRPRSKQSAHVSRLASNLKPMEEHFGDYRATQLTSAEIDKWVEDALRHGRRKSSSKPAKPASINRSLQLLSQAYRLAIATGQLTTAPRIRHLSEVGNARTGFFSAMEFRSVLSNLPAYLRDFALFAWLTAW